MMTSKPFHYTQRQLFHVKDVATQFNTSVDDILHIAKDKHITLEYLVKSERKITLAVPVSEQDEDGKIVDSYGEYRLIYLKIGDRMDISLDAIKQLLANQFFYEGDNMGHELYGDGFIVANNLEQGAKITIDDIMITYIDRNKLPNLLSDQTHSGKSQPEETELNQAQKALVAIVYGLMQSHKNTYKNGEKPNISAIVSMALTGITDSNGNHKRGFGNTTLTEAIKNALQNISIKDD